MLKSSLQNKILRTLPDDRPVTALQVVENIEKCPRGFYPISKTYDQDSDADLGEKSIFKSSSYRYLCISKTEGLPNFVLQEIYISYEKLGPPGYSLLNRTADTGQKIWKKRQIFYHLVNQKETKTAITDIIVCSKLKQPPVGFTFAGEVNGITLCYKMGNTESNQVGTPPERPPKPLSPSNNLVYPSIGESDHDYEILRPGSGPGYGSPTGPLRPAPKPPAPFSPPSHLPVQHQNSVHTLGTNLHYGLEGVPFVTNPLYFANSKDKKTLLPLIKIKTIQQILKEYDYPFTVEQQIQ